MVKLFGRGLTFLNKRLEDFRSEYGSLITVPKDKFVDTTREFISIVESGVNKIESIRDRGIDDDEYIVFYPSLGNLKDNQWEVEIRGLVFENREIANKVPSLAT
jgi:hypothetical protein